VNSGGDLCGRFRNQVLEAKKNHIAIAPGLACVIIAGGRSLIRGGGINKYK